MIVVAEGPSAAGKSTWARTFPTRHVIPETGRIEVPSSMSDVEHAAFWNDVNCARWSKTVGVEESTGLAVCDTDPLKLHYDYCLARVGATDWGPFDCGVAEAEKAIAEERLGIADLVVVHLPDDDALARQRESDRSRRRRNFELHRRLAEPLRDWYLALVDLTPAESAGDSSASIRRRFAGTDSTEDCSAPGWLISLAEKAAHNDYPPAASHPAHRGTSRLGPPARNRATEQPAPISVGRPLRRGGSGRVLHPSSDVGMRAIWGLSAVRRRVPVLADRLSGAHARTTADGRSESPRPPDAGYAISR